MLKFDTESYMLLVLCDRCRTPIDLASSEEDYNDVYKRNNKKVLCWKCFKIK